MSRVDINLSNIEYLAISDVHLQDLTGLNGRRMLELFKVAKDSPIEGVILVGDIFEFILGSSSYFKRKYQAFGDALTELVEAGKRVVFVEGNHEFDLARLAWEGVEFVEEQDFVLSMNCGSKVKFTHGDQVFAPRAYQYFRKVVKSRLFLFLASFIPGGFMDRMALKGAEVSRAQDQYRTMDHSKILGAMGSWLGVEADYGVFGHFHVPYANPNSHGRGLLVSMDSWENPSLLGFGQTGVVRYQYENGQLLPHGPYPAEEHPLE